MTECVVGFLFNKPKTQVVLIEKRRPEWQKWKLNGVGGHVEPGETTHRAMVREFREETGINTSWEEWNRFAIISSWNWKVHFFWALGTPQAASTTTDEEILICSARHLPANVLPNLKWLIPMCFDNDISGPTHISYRK